MSKHTIQQISDYTALAEASYANFARSKIDLSQQDATEIKAAIQDAIIKTDPTEKNTPLKFFANYVTDNYQIIAHYADRVENGFRIKIYEDFYENIQKDLIKDKVSHTTPSESSFSATLFRNKNGENKGQYVLAIRGTWGFADLVNTDIGDVFANGVGYEQVADLYNFWHKGQIYC